MDEQLHDYRHQIQEVLRSSEVISILFVKLEHSLIVDNRKDNFDRPVVLVDRMVSTPRDRFISFRRLRPGLPVPTEIALVPWPFRVRDFVRLGIDQLLIERCQESGEDVLADAMASLGTLRQLEKEADRAMIRGDGMETIWERQEA